MTTANNEQYGENNTITPCTLSESQKELCKKLDKIHKVNELQMMPSEMLKGAIFTSNKKVRVYNPDWLSQAANSLREILYPFYSKESEKNLKKMDFYRNSAIKNKDFDRDISTIYNRLNGLAHHGIAKKSKLSKREIDNFDFDNLMYEYEILLRHALTRQLDLYNQIDNFFAKGLEFADKETAQALMEANTDAKDYFFSKAPVSWIYWHEEQGFFEVLNRATEDKTRYSFKLPQLAFLVRVIEQNGDQEQVVKIIEKVDCENNFNPEVLDQFLWMAQKLSVQNLVKILPKIDKEKWVYLMRNFRNSGFSYEPLVKNLVKTQSDQGLLLLAEAMLLVKSEQTKDDLLYNDNYFYLQDIDETGIFEALSKLKGEFTEKGIELITGILNQLVEPNDNSQQDIFKFQDKFYVSDLDFFELSFSEPAGMSLREDVKNLLKAYVTLIKSVLSECVEVEARKIYDDYIVKLSDSEIFWRIKLFAMSRCPKVFERDLKEALYRIFTEKQRYTQLLFGTEYLKTLQVVFKTWPDLEQRDYVEKIFEKFAKLIAGFPNEYWHKNDGWEILSSIHTWLKPDEIQKAEKLFGQELVELFKPMPVISSLGTGVKHIINKSPVQFADWNIEKVIAALANELSLEALKKNPDDNFFEPINAEGVGNELKKDMQVRMDRYLAHAREFLDPAIHTHYTCSFLQGVEVYLQNNFKLTETSLNQLFTLFESIKTSNPDDFKQANEDRWLAKWPGILIRMAELLKIFTTKEYENLFINKRREILDLVEFLLVKGDSEFNMDSGRTNDLYSIAINSASGLAFEAFVNFLYLDGKSLKMDVWKVYCEAVERASLPVLFLIGRYLPSFYYRDETSVIKLCEHIFPVNKAKLAEFCAAWEGYLSSSVYAEMFKSFENYYSYALSLKSVEYPERSRFKDLDQGLGAHLALAFAHFDDVEYTEVKKHPLFESLWSGDDLKKQKAFISFLGNGIIRNAIKSNLKDQRIEPKKLLDFWQLILEKNVNPEVYAEFGTWINYKEDIFENYNLIAEMLAKTLEKSQGQIEWDFGLKHRLVEFAQANPIATVKIFEQYLLLGILGKNSKKWFHLNDETIAAFEILFNHASSKSQTIDLVDKLLIKGGSQFRPLRMVVDGNLKKI